MPALLPRPEARSRGTPAAFGHLSRFSSNLLVGGTGVAAYAEDDWQKVCIGMHEFFTAVSHFCSVCIMSEHCASLSEEDMNYR